MNTQKEGVLYDGGYVIKISQVQTDEKVLADAFVSKEDRHRKE